jgi:hypothetical protein
MKAAQRLRSGTAPTFDTRVATAGDAAQDSRYVATATVWPRRLSAAVVY